MVVSTNDHITQLGEESWTRIFFFYIWYPLYGCLHPLKVHYTPTICNNNSPKIKSRIISFPIMFVHIYTCVYSYLCGRWGEGGGEGLGNGVSVGCAFLGRLKASSRERDGINRVEGLNLKLEEVINEVWLKLSKLSFRPNLNGNEIDFYKKIWTLMNDDPRFPV